MSRINDIPKPKGYGVKKRTNFEQRYTNPLFPIVNSNGTSSTHKMISFEADGKYYAVPTIVNINGKLTELTSDKAIDYALKNNEFVEFNTEKEAQEYAEGGYKVGTPMEHLAFGGNISLTSERGIPSYRELLNESNTNSNTMRINNLPTNRTSKRKRIPQYANGGFADQWLRNILGNNGNASYNGEEIPDPPSLDNPKLKGDGVSMNDLTGYTKQFTKGISPSKYDNGVSSLLGSAINTGINAIPGYGETIGTALAVAGTVGNLVGDASYDYVKGYNKSDAAAGFQSALNPVSTWTDSFTNIGKERDSTEVLGTLAKLIAPGWGSLADSYSNHLDKVEYEKKEKERKLKEYYDNINAQIPYDRQELANTNRGNKDMNYFKFGGRINRLPYGGSIGRTDMPSLNSVPIDENADLAVNDQGTIQGSHEQGQNIPVYGNNAQPGGEVEPGEVVVKLPDGSDFVLSKRLGTAQMYMELSQAKEQLVNTMKVEPDVTRRNSIKREIDKLDNQLNQLPAIQEQMKQEAGMTDDGMQMQTPQFPYGGIVNDDIDTTIYSKRGLMNSGVRESQADSIIGKYGAASDVDPTILSYLLNKGYSDAEANRIALDMTKPKANYENTINTMPIYSKGGRINNVPKLGYGNGWPPNSDALRKSLEEQYGELAGRAPGKADYPDEFAWDEYIKGKKSPTLEDFYSDYYANPKEYETWQSPPSFRGVPVVGKPDIEDQENFIKGVSPNRMRGERYQKVLNSTGDITYEPRVSDNGINNGDSANGVGNGNKGGLNSLKNIFGSSDFRDNLGDALTMAPIFENRKMIKQTPEIPVPNKLKYESINTEYDISGAVNNIKSLAGETAKFARMNSTDVQSGMNRLNRINQVVAPQISQLYTTKNNQEKQLENMNVQGKNRIDAMNTQLMNQYDKDTAARAAGMLQDYSRNNVAISDAMIDILTRKDMKDYQSKQLALDMIANNNTGSFTELIKSGKFDKDYITAYGGLNGVKKQADIYRKSGTQNELANTLDELYTRNGGK